MTVAELIAELQKMPQDAEVEFLNDAEKATVTGVADQRDGWVYLSGTWNGRL